MTSLIALRSAIGASRRICRLRPWSWRCMEGQVYRLHRGRQSAVRYAKADSSREPSPAVRDYCTASPEAAFCSGLRHRPRDPVRMALSAVARPRSSGKIATPDARGFLAEIWYPLTPPK